MKQENSEALLDRLVAAAVLKETDGGLSIGEGFDETRRQYADQIDKVDAESFNELAAAPFDGPEVGYAALEAAAADAFDTRFEGDERTQFAAAVLALATVDRDLKPRETLSAAYAISRVEHSIPTDGVPGPFTPIRGDEIEAFLERHPTAIIYFWREDCEPCDRVSADLEALVADGTIGEEIGLGAVYGPNWAEELNERYDVGVAPTLLFCAGGAIDSRLVGPPYTQSIAKEVDMIVDVG